MAARTFGHCSVCQNPFSTTSYLLIIENRICLKGFYSNMGFCQGFGARFDPGTYKQRQVLDLPPHDGCCFPPAITDPEQECQLCRRRLLTCGHMTVQSKSVVMGNFVLMWDPNHVVGEPRPQFWLQHGSEEPASACTGFTSSYILVAACSLVSCVTF
ncbi:hypothetical protein XENOCAPTIV_005732, partial [Xenoophorus captivus]